MLSPLRLPGLDAWITREPDDQGEPPLEPSQEQQLLDMLFDSIGALAAAEPPQTSYRFRSGYALGYYRAVAAAQRILEQAGARPRPKRKP